MSITYEELQGYPRAGFSQGRFQGVRVFRVAWSDWPAFFGQLFGTFSFSDGGATITLPSTFPGVSHTYITDVSLEGVGKITSGVQSSLSNDANEYAYADLTCTYAFMPPPDAGISGAPTIPSGTILTYSSNLGVEYLTIPGRQMHFDLAGDPVLPDDAPFGVRVPTEDMQLSFMHVPMIPTALRQFRGRTNDAVFMGYQIETVLFQGASISREFQMVVPPDVPALYRLDYHFLVKQIFENATYKGWNHFYKPDGDGAGNFWCPVENEGGSKPFPSSDFTQLFTLA